MTISRAASYARTIRAHYHQYLEKRGGQDYNPVLDDPHDPRNTRHWTHGMTEGPRQAGCKCVRCAKAARKAAKEEAAKRLDKRLAEHRARLTVLLTQRLLDLDAESAGEIAARVVDGHRVVNKFKATVAYDPLAVRRDLRATRAVPILLLDDDELTVLVEVVIAELGR